MTYRSQLSAWATALLGAPPATAPVTLEVVEPDYTETIAKLVKASLWRRRVSAAERSHTEDLLLALGCRCTDTRREDGLSIAYAPPLAHEALVRATLIQVLERHFEIEGKKSDVFALVEGLSRNDRWRVCLERTNSALALARLLVLFTTGVGEGKRFNTHVQLREAALPGVCNLLNAWLRPDVPITDIFRPADLARALFGEAWCAIVLNGVTQSSQIDVLIGVHRPQFLPGLLPGIMPTAAAPLPDLSL